MQAPLTTAVGSAPAARVHRVEWSKVVAGEPVVIQVTAARVEEVVDSVMQQPVKVAVLVADKAQEPLELVVKVAAAGAALAC